MTKKNDHSRLRFDDIEGDLATPVQFAQLTGLHENTVRTMCGDGRVEAVRLGERYFIPFRKIFGVEREEAACP